MSFRFNYLAIQPGEGRSEKQAAREPMAVRGSAETQTVREASNNLRDGLERAAEAIYLQ